MNRVIAAYDQMEKQIAQRIKDGLTTKEAVENSHRRLDMPIDEYCMFQEMKSLAVSEGKLSVEEGVTIYNSMGESVETFNEQPIHVKTVLTKIFSELISSRIAA